MSEEFVKKVNGKRVAASEASPSSPLKTTIDGKVSKTGDTMSGRLTLQKTLSQVITGTGTAASSSGSTYYPAKWKYDLGIATPVAGDQLVIQLPCAGHDYGVYLSTDNGTTYYPVAHGTGSSRCTTRYPSGAYVCVVFETFVSGNNNAGRVTDIFPVAGGTSRTTVTTGCWRIVNDYDSDNNYDRLYNANGRFYAGATGCSSYSLVCLDNTGKYSKLISSGTGTGNTKTVNTSGKFVFPSSVLYYAADNTVAANTLVTSTYVTYIAHPTVDMRYSTNYNTTSNPAFTTNSPAYIECNINSDGTWSPTEKAITQTLVSGKYYIFLGITYSTAYQLSLAPNHPIFYYDGTNLVSALLTKNSIGASSTNGNISVAGTDVTVYTHPTQTAYSAKGSATKVPKITTDSTGHVTSIEEVTISGVTPASHTHGNIQNGGTLQTTDVSIASGDKLVVTDASDSNKIARTSVSFDGSTTTTALTPKGTFESFAKAADITSAINNLDSNKTSTDGKNVQVKVTEADGKIYEVNITTDTTANINNSVYYVAGTTDYAAWVASHAYAVGDNVVANGKAYTCKTAHTSGSSFSTTKWNAIATPTLKGVLPAEVTSLYAGLKIAYKMPITGGSSSTVLSLSNGTTELGSKNIRINDSNLTTHLPVNTVVVLTYDGTYWRFSNYDSNSTYNGMVNAYVNNAGDAAKTANSTNFKLTNGVTILLTNNAANTKAAALTLNVNSTGAKALYINGTISSATNYTVPVGTYFCHYKEVSGTGQWHLYTDGTFPASKLALDTPLDVSNGGTGKTSVTSNSFLVGNGSSAMVEKTPAEVLSLIGAQGAMTEMTTQEVTDFINDLGDL